MIYLGTKRSQVLVHTTTLPGAEPLVLSFPVVYTQYGDFQFNFHEREIFPSHREIVVATNELDSITGSSGTIAWELVRPVTKLFS